MLQLLILVLSAVVVVATLKPLGFAALTVLVALSLILKVRITSRPERFIWIIFGLIVPTTSKLGDVSLASALLLLITYSDKQDRRTTWAAPFLLCLFVNWLILFFAEFDFQSWRQIYAQAGPSIQSKAQTIQTILSQSPPVYFSELVLLIKLCLLAQLSIFYSSRVAERAWTITGLVVGLFVNFLVLVYQLIATDLSKSSSDFWLSQGRFAGLFSDPNAFGVTACLLAPFLFDACRRKKYISNLSFLLPLIPLATGSRSYLLGIFFALWIIAIISWTRLVAAISLAVIAAYAGFIFVSDWSPQFVSDLSLILPSGVSRALSALAPWSIGQTFSSRMIFFQIDLELFLNNLISGIGLGVFKNIVPAVAQRLELGTGLWTDNPNSFYLGILVELGLLGGAGLIWTVSNCSIKKGAWTTHIAFVYALLALLLFGPHFNFTEVVIAAAILLSLTLDFKQSDNRFSACLFIGLVIIFGTSRTFLSDQGLMGYESDGSINYRWISRRSSFSIKCSEANRAKLRLRALPFNAPLTAEISTSIDKRMTIDLVPGRINEQEFDCPVSSVDALSSESRLWINLELSKIFVPALVGLGQDYRILAAQLIVDDVTS